MSSEDTLREYQGLLEKAEIARMNLLGVVIHAIGNLNLNDPPQALRTLLDGLEMCVEADGAIEAFRRKVTLNFKKENQSDGNRTNQSAA